MKKTKKQSLKAPFFLTMLAIAVFWSSWYLVVGSLPITEEIKITDNLVWALPFGLSRLWDIIFAPAILLFSSRLVREYGRIDSGFQPLFDCGLLIGFLANAVFAFLYWQGSGLIFCLVAFLGLGFFMSAMLAAADNIQISRAFGLGYSFVLGAWGFGIVFGFVLAPVFAALSLFVCLLAIPFGLFLKFCSRLWHKIIHSRVPIIWEW